MYRQGVKNRFEASLNGSSDSVDKGSSSKSCSPTQENPITDSHHPKIHPSVRRNGLDSASIIENNKLEPTSPMPPMLTLPSTRMLYNRSTERTCTGLIIFIKQSCLL